MIKGPFTNRWGTKPGPNYKQCEATTKAGTQCRCCAPKGKEVCSAHEVKNA